MDKELLALMQDTARKLTGRAVTVRISEPLTTRAAFGAMYKGLDGLPVIDIHPGAPDYFYELTHEIAHVILHFDIMARVNTSTAGALYPTPSKHTDKTTMTREQEAETLAETWRKYAANNWMNHYGASKSLFIAKLETLLYDYKNGV